MNMRERILLHLPPLVISSFIKSRFMNHTAKIQVNIAPKGITTFAVSLSNILRKSIPKTELNVRQLNAIETAVVVIAAHSLDTLSSSAIYAVSTSWNEIVDVSEASITSRKKTDDHSEANGIPLNISGKVTKTREAPSVG